MRHAVILCVMTLFLAGCADRAATFKGSEAAIVTLTHEYRLEGKSKSSLNDIDHELTSLTVRYREHSRPLRWVIEYSDDTKAIAKRAQQRIQQGDTPHEVTLRAIQGQQLMLVTISGEKLVLPECPAYGFQSDVALTGCIVEHNRMQQIRYRESLTPRHKEAL